MEIDSAAQVGYLYQISDLLMPRTVTFAIAALFSNLLLFYLMMVVENRDGYLLVFKALRVILVTSVIMQILIAIGVVKLRQLK